MTAVAPPEPRRFRAVGELLPHLQWVVAALLAAWERDGLDARIIETYRSIERQDWLYASGRFRPGRRVTKVKGGDSMHNYRIAFDFAVFIDGKPRWDVDTPKIGDQWRRAGQLAEALGLEWGGSWPTFPDWGHVQLTGGITNAQIKKATPEQINARLDTYYRNHGFDRMVETSLA
jgi:peptidoglycan L-alanyl-D-glutamate endopeptidase CwlK